jgi:hypothetical protein
MDEEVREVIRFTPDKAKRTGREGVNLSCPFCFLRGLSREGASAARDAAPVVAAVLGGAGSAR